MLGLLSKGFPFLVVKGYGAGAIDHPMKNRAGERGFYRFFGAIAVHSWPTWRRGLLGDQFAETASPFALPFEASQKHALRFGGRAPG